MKAFKTQIYPTKEQATQIDKTIGCCRYVYNQGLAFKIAKYKEKEENVSIYELIKQLPQQKKENEWLKEVEAQALQQSLLDLQSAYSKFFREKRGFPNFHKKGQKDTYRSLNAKRTTLHGLQIPKIGVVKTAEKIKKKWIIHCITLSRRAGKYFISILIDYVPPKRKPSMENMVGIDVGIKTFAVLSNGKIYENLKTFRKHEKRLKILQRRLSKTEKKSNNNYKAKIKVAKLNYKVANIRNDYLNKISREIANQYSLVAVEALNVKGMMKNHKLAKSIADCSWNSFVTKLAYKCQWSGCELRKIGRFEKSSKTCSVCGCVMDEMPLKIREWDCPHCHTHHDRDLNASKNILNFALRAI